MEGSPPSTAAAVPPRLQSWIARRWFTPSGCLVAEAVGGLEPTTVFTAFARLPRAIFLDSSGRDEPAGVSTPTVRLGRHSFVAADPIHEIVVEDAAPAGGDVTALEAAVRLVRSLLRELACPPVPGLPPFQGGLAGFVSYEYGLARLGLQSPPPAATGVPVLQLGVYDVVFAFDHDAGRGWFISQGVPATGPVARRRRAETRLDAVLTAAAGKRPQRNIAAGERPQGNIAAGERPQRNIATGERPQGNIAAGKRPQENIAAGAQPESAAAPPCFAHALPQHPAVRSTHDAASYCRMVEAGRELIHAGDVFQVNLAQQFAIAATVDPAHLHLHARDLNPAPFAGFLDTGGMQIVSMSPERFLQVSGGVHGGGRVCMHPIKGTRRIIASPEADLYAAADLGASDKDRAENVMIVDLVRNDLARVCLPESVRVEALCRLERYRYVQHLVSVVSGRLRRPLGGWDAVDAATPGGSVTGAPKHRACEIIAALEGVARGVYCGSLGYVGFDGAADFNLLIRTFVVTPGLVRFAAGGGVTAASDPAAEHAESLHKAEGMLRVLTAVGLGAGDPAHHDRGSGTP
jgi:para-aminobenzoate synthetase component 1